MKNFIIGFITVAGFVTVFIGLSYLAGFGLAHTGINFTFMFPGVNFGNLEYIALGMLAVLIAIVIFAIIKIMICIGESTNNE
jgi:hypothetical protein